MKLSVIIPSFKELFLQKTVDSLLETSELDEVEIIVVLDGGWLKIPLKEDPRVKVIQIGRGGMRKAINTGIAKAQGEFLMKVDSHCLFAQGFDKCMVENAQKDWLLIPRRYSLDDENWTRDMNRPYRDYHYLAKPCESKYGSGLTVLDWFKRNGKLIDDTMIFQGSCWLADREYFMKHIGFLDDREETYGSFVGEQHEIGLKYWLGGGAIKVNKKTWYAHLSKRPRHYIMGIYDRTFKSAPRTNKQHTWVAKHWMSDSEPNMIHPFQWLIDRFSPPTW